MRWRLAGAGLLLGVFSELVGIPGVAGAVIALLSMVASLFVARAIAPKPVGTIAAALFGARIVLALAPVGLAIGTALLLAGVADAAGLVAWTILAVATWKGAWVDRATSIALFIAVACGLSALALSFEPAELAAAAHRAIFVPAAMLLAASCFARARESAAELEARTRIVPRIAGATGAFLMIAALSAIEQQPDHVGLFAVAGSALFAIGYASVPGRIGILAAILASLLLATLVYIEASSIYLRRVELFVLLCSIPAFVLGTISLFRAPRRPWVRVAAWSHLVMPPILFLAAMYDGSVALVFGLIPVLYFTALARLS